MKNMKRMLCVLLTMIMILAAFPLYTFAAGAIDPDRNVDFTIYYLDGETVIPNASFRLYRVADVDEYAGMTLTEQFEPYENTVSGLANLDSLDQESWLELAATLKGYVQANALVPAASGSTGDDGKMNVTVKPGLYLVIGYRATTPDYYTYSAVPFMAFLPGMDETANVWTYSVMAFPKFSKDYNPNDNPDDALITRKVLKVWDDKGYETIRPSSIEVQLLRDGKVFETVTLDANNNWRFVWDNLSSKNEWTVVEKTPENYTVSISRTGITFTLTNKYEVSVTSNDPPVQKRVTGDVPSTAGTFVFTMEARKNGNPMPEGSTGSKKTVQHTGAGKVEFGEIIFTEPGVYEYLIYEVNNGLTGYTYDNNIYLMRCEVVLKDGKLSCTRTITDDHGKTYPVVEFANTYKTPGNKLPQTGMLWYPVPVLLLAGMFFVCLGVVQRRRSTR